MPIDVRMPKLSDNMEEGIIIRWMKAPGDAVVKGEPLAEVETDKADVELEASDSGTLHEIKIAEGQSAAVGAVIAVLADGEAATQPSPDKQSRAAGAAAAAEPTKQPSQRAPAARAPLDAPRARGAEEATESRKQSPSVRASPLAWRLADQAGVNLAEVRGSGPAGRIVKRDVEASMHPPSLAAERRSEPAQSAPHAQSTERTESTRPPAIPAEASTAGGARRIEASRMRMTIAKRMAEAKRDIPHFYVTAEIDMSEAMHLRDSIKRREAMPGLTVTHLLLRALAVGLLRHPRVNASWREGGIELHDDVNLGIAVAVEDGLVVPVLHRAQLLTLGELAARAAVLTEKARTGKFGGEDLTGGTFSLSNVGMLDVEELTAVINPPQAAVLAVGAVKDRPIVRDGQLAVAKTMRATLSCDHRVLNGVEGGRFLEEIKGILENPVTLLLE
jgi:pyruvate dehydrogenase E2 component (dihydrolipoamide acetyltransferase)